MHQKVIHENARLVPCPVADNNARTGGTFERTNRASPFEPETATRARHPPKLPVFPRNSRVSVGTIGGRAHGDSLVPYG